MAYMKRNAKPRADRRPHLDIPTTTRWIVPLALAALSIWLGVSACSRERPTPSAATPAARPAQPGAEPAQPGAEPATPTSSGELPNVGMATVEPTPPPQVYIVQSGDTLGGIAARFGCQVDAIMRANNITDANALQVGKQLNIPFPQIESGPSARLLPDSEFVYGPAYVDFDVAAFVAGQGGYLANYSEPVNGKVLSGAEIVSLVAHHYGVGPRLLLAMIELKGGWVTNPSPMVAALGRHGAKSDQFSRQLAWAADRLNQGYYDWRGRGMELLTWDDGTSTRYASNLNAGTAGLQFFLSLYATKSQWATWVGDGSDSFIATYRSLFGDPAKYAVEPLVPAGLANPSLSLPWAKGETWHFTGGPHGAWEDGCAWAALDFVPIGGPFGCALPPSPARAAAAGLVIYSQDGEVMIDLDEDGHEQTGWVLFYLHMASDGRVALNTHVKPGDQIGYPSCEGGFSESSHLHFARKYNGEWIAADGPLPFILSGWQAHSSGTDYDGTLTRDGQTCTAAEVWDPQVNGLTADR